MADAVDALRTRRAAPSRARPSPRSRPGRSRWWPNRSARVTTPDRQALIADQLGRRVGLGRAARTQASSVEPPPISNSSARRPGPRSSGRAAFQRQLGLLAGGDHVERSPVSARTRARNARRWRRGGTPRWRWRARRAPGGAPAGRRRHAARPSRGPSPRRSARRCAAAPRPAARCGEKLSSTRKPSPGRRADQQAAVVGAEIERRVGRPDVLRRAAGCGWRIHSRADLAGTIGGGRPQPAATAATGQGISEYLPDTMRLRPGDRCEDAACVGRPAAGGPAGCGHVPVASPACRLPASPARHRRASRLGDSLAVELPALTRAALVRIQVPQPTRPAPLPRSISGNAVIPRGPDRPQPRRGAQSCRRAARRCPPASPAA